MCVVVEGGMMFGRKMYVEVEGGMLFGGDMNVEGRVEEKGGGW
jgi:hypothetical protein